MSNARRVLVLLAGCALGVCPARSQGLDPFLKPGEQPPVRPAVPVSTPIPVATPMPVSTPIPQPVPGGTTPIPAPKPTPLMIPGIEPGAAPTPVARPSYPAPGGGPAAPGETVIRMAPGTASTAASQAQMQFDIANGFYARKQYDLAAPEFERYVNLLYTPTPHRETALFRLGECYRALGQATAAQTSYEAAVREFPAGDFVGVAAYRLGEIYFEQNNYASALPFFAASATRVKEQDVVLSARYYQARCLENLNRRRETRPVYEAIAAVIERNPFRDLARMALAQQAADFGRKSDAMKQFEQIAQDAARPSIKAESIMKAGVLAGELKQTEKATTLLLAALKMPEIGEWKGIAELGLARIYYDTGEYKKLINSFPGGAASAGDETRAELLLLIGNSHRQLEDFPKARSVYDRLVNDFSATPQAAEARYQRLITLYSANDPTLYAAVDEYLLATPGGERANQATLLKAEALFKTPDYAAALPLYERLAKAGLASNLRAEALFKLGWCHGQAREWASAIETYTKFLQEFPRHALVASGLAQRALAFQQLKNFASALADFDKLIKEHPKAKEREIALQQKGLLLGQQQDNAGMAQAFAELLKDYPKTAAAAQANYWIGWAAFESKNYAGAIDNLEAARKLDAEQYFERASLRILLSQYYLEMRDALASEVDAYARKDPKVKVPEEIYRWLGLQYFGETENADTPGKAGDKPDYAKAEKYLLAYTAALGDKRLEQTDLWLVIGKGQLKQAKFDEAVKSINTYLETVPEPGPRARGLLALGEAYLGAAKYDDARKVVEQAMILQPEGRVNAEARLLAGQIEMNRGQFDAASKSFMSVALLYDQDSALTPQALSRACEAFNKAGNTAEASRVLNELRTRFPEFPVKKIP